MARAKIEGAEKGMVTGSWHDFLRLESHLVAGITDRGIKETIDVATQRPLDMDDLVVAVELAGGSHILLPSNSRVVIEENGNLIIQLY